MALTPEDVVNKRFQPTKFREGYDQDEVDDFLDEVVVELRRLNQENDELKQRVIQDDEHGGGRTSDDGAASEETAEPVTSAEPDEPAEAQVEEPESAAAVVAAPAVAEPAEDETQSTNNLLQLARRLHDEHVREGADRRDALIAEGHATAARVVAEAESKQRAQMAVLDQERSGLQNRIDELRTFERDYRAKLKSYIEGQLRDLDTSAGTPASSAPAPAPAPGSGSGGESSDTGSTPTYRVIGG